MSGIDYYVPELQALVPASFFGSAFERGELVREGDTVKYIPQPTIEVAPRREVRKSVSSWDQEYLQRGNPVESVGPVVEPVTSDAGDGAGTAAEGRDAAPPGDGGGGHGGSRDGGRTGAPDADDIVATCDALKLLLLEKNEKYDGSALKPDPIFTDLSISTLLKARIGDKLRRLQATNDDEDALQDLAGYLILLLVARKRGV